MLSILTKILPLLLTWYIMTGCGEAIDPSFSRHSLPDWQLTVYDSIVIPTPGRTVYIMDEDPSRGLYLGIKPDWKTYVLIDADGREIAANTIVGEGPNRVRQIAKIGLVGDEGGIHRRQFENGIDDLF